MKKIIIAAVLSCCIMFVSCNALQGIASQLQGLANLANCEYALKNVSNLTVAGVNVKNITDGKTIKPKINLQYINYAKEVYRFFADNKVKIRHRAQKYENSNADFIRSFYDMCKTWNGWSWNVPVIDIETPENKTPMRDLAAMVIYDITTELPKNARKMMANIANHEMVKCVTSPAEKYEYIFDMLLRIPNPKNRQK